MGWNVKKVLSNPKNILAAAAAPFTAGASLALLSDDENNTILDHITGAASAKEANRRNIEAQQAINDQNIAMQKETNDISINLANTAHQREVADLHAAGLNPILSNGGSGAITPTLGTAVATAPQIQNEMPGGYLAQAGQIANIAGIAASAQQAVSAGKLADAQANNAIAENPYIAKTKKAQIANLNANTALQDAQTTNTDVNSISQDMANKLNADSGTSKDSWGPERAMQNVIGRIFGRKVSSARNSAKRTYNLNGRKYTY